MSGALLGTVFAASLFGSLHCVGMCGGFVAFYAADAQAGRRHAAHIAYHAGRLVTYVTLGAVSGGIGYALDLAGEAAGLGRAAAAVAGALITLWGVVLLLRSAGVTLPSAAVPARLRRGAVHLLTGFAARPPMLRAGLLGLSSTLLPCGWLYAFAVAAAGTGTPATGALVMASFWAGSVPLLAGLGAGIGLLGVRLRRHLPVASALLMLAVGLASLFGRLNVPKLAAASAESALHADTPPCHRGGP